MRFEEERVVVMEVILLILAIMLLVVLKLWKLLFGKDELNYNCCKCENFHVSNLYDESDPCNKCKNGSCFKRDWSREE